MERELQRRKPEKQEAIVEVRPALSEDLNAMDAAVPAAARAALEHGHGQVGIGVAPDNVPARRLYERLGFTGSIPYLDRYSIMGEEGHPHDSADACIFLTANSEMVAGARRQRP